MQSENWRTPELRGDIPQGDMPGDRIYFHPDSIEKAKRIFPYVLEELEQYQKRTAGQKCVIAVCGGSGVGKTTIASLITYYLNEMEIGAYTHSGDNYPKRFPKYNDAERMQRYFCGGLERLISKDLYTPKRGEKLQELFEKGEDSNPGNCQEYDWLKEYQLGGIEALKGYLGTKEEIDFSLINRCIEQFKSGKEKILLRRMGRNLGELYYEEKDFSQIEVMVIEWTHGNSDFLKGVDIPIYLHSTPEETLSVRKARNRNSNTDSFFVNQVLRIEQELLIGQSKKAKVIMNRDGRIRRPQTQKTYGPMLNAYPDSMGGNLKETINIIETEEWKDCFSSFYILPSLYHSDLDRGFSVIDYDLNEELAKEEDLSRIRELGIDLKLDFILNHASVNSPQFQDLLEKGEKSVYKDFFINWNRFWEGYGNMTAEGYIMPEQKYLDKMFFRKPGLPILMVSIPSEKEGEKREIPYWNTFYQEVKVDETTGEKHYLGQMDLNINSPLVWEYYKEALGKISGYGATIVRLDAFAYAPKLPGEKNFLNEPGTWELLEKVQALADTYGLRLLPEIHASYEEKIYRKVAEKGYMIYDFFLPGLLIAAIEKRDGSMIFKWAEEIIENRYMVVNMLGCHDGIPLLDLKGMLEEEEIQELINLIVARGGYVKDLHGQKNVYYQVNATYYSALGEDDKKMLFARAVQLFMPGKPQIWYLDILAGKNDYAAVQRAGEGGHKEINRTNFSGADIKENITREVVEKQLELIRLRNTHQAFGENAQITVRQDGKKVIFTWRREEHRISLVADFEKLEYDIV